MYIITNKRTNQLWDYGDNIKYEQNGYITLLDSKITYIPDDINLTQSDLQIVDEVKANPQKYCYTEAEGFYLNPDYVEPDPTNTYGISDELFNQIKSDYREKIAQEVSENGYNA